MTAARRKPNRANGDGSISVDRQRSRPDAKVYRVEYGPRGNRRTERVRGTHKDATDVLARLRAEAEATGTNGAAPRAGRKAWTVGTWVDHWHANVVGARPGRHGDGLSASSKRREAWAVGEIKKALGDKSLRTLTSEDVESFLGLRAAGVGCERRAWTQASCRDVKNLLARALDVAINRGHASAPNKARDAGIPGHAARAEPQDALSREDAQRLYRVARADGSPAALVLALQLTTGLRPGEAYGLQWGRVDMEAGTLRIDRAKTPTGRRTLRLSAVALAVLGDARRMAELRARDPEAYVFPGAVRSPHVTAYALIDRLEAFAAAENIAVQPDGEAARFPHPHELRHTFASHMLADGADVQRVAAIMGDKVETVLRVYAHIIDKVRGEAEAVLVDAMYGEASMRRTMDYAAACEWHATQQGLDPITDVLRAAGIPYTVDQTGGFTMCVRVPLVEGDSQYLYLTDGDNVGASFAGGVAICRYWDHGDDADVCWLDLPYNATAVPLAGVVDVVRQSLRAGYCPCPVCELGNGA